MLFIGITGGVGAGKSEILKYIEKHYLCEIYMADEVAHEVKKKGTKCYKMLVDLLSSDCLDEMGEIDKRKMAAKIFADNELLIKVNEIIHPAVKDFLIDALKRAGEEKKVELFFVEAALLIETGYNALVDEMWYVYAEREVRVKRLKEARGYSDERIEGIMGNQLSEEAYRNNSNFVIDNSTNLDYTYRQIRNKLEGFTWQE